MECKKEDSGMKSIKPPTHPTSSGLLGSGSSINPEEICEEQHLHFEKGIFFFFSFYLS